MPAHAADIGAATRDVVVSTWSDATIAARYPAARDGSVTSADGYFDQRTDADVVIAARGALVGVERRRFAVTAQEPFWADPTTGMPCARLIDAEQRADGVFLVARIEVDLDAETTAFELFG